MAQFNKWLVGEFSYRERHIAVSEIELLSTSISKEGRRLHSVVFVESSIVENNDSLTIKAERHLFKSYSKSRSHRT